MTPAEIQELKSRIDQYESEINRLHKLAYTCPLTGISNRRAFNEKLQYEWERSLRSKTPFPIAIVFIDLVKFKQINDSLGHQEGDRILAEVGRILAEIGLRPFDLVARFGGDEFAIVLSDCSNDGAERIAEETKRLLSEAGISASIGGCAMIPNPDGTPEMLIKMADERMYKNKLSI